MEDKKPSYALGYTLLTLCGIGMIFELSTCGSPTKSTYVAENQISTKQEAPKEPECGCSKLDAERLVNASVMEYNSLQNNLASQYAKRATVVDMERRPDCSFVAKIKVESTVSVLTGAAPRYLEKRVKCDGVEAYMD